ncbi:DedA family protein [Lactobacillus ultunensis]|uniref:SNARE-like domain protein n=1 Tax=Lactobacillus ultunensis DSM 16047 TaxID=525365 RepID=C2EMU6_9LACO|nr:DedA family protein [Lactobacillus ultunensis]EEJ72115.1 SNARE-like domain protein [Lactobacillus ultunensis DSM 16047]KRL80918.1 alkaline phosphatase [Lactobacillus ultunensis DSM 16047]QQP27769.1 DedA family protein [Lactobacillus ultunensis]
MTNIVFDLINQFGYLAISLLIAIENIFPPIPSEVILSFAGFATHHSQMTVPWVVISSTIGAVLGALILYWIGTLLNEERLEKIFDHRMFKMLGFKKGDVQKAITWFNKYGTGAIFYGRCIPVIRSLISIPAGTAKVKLSKFLIYTTLGSLIWNTVLVSLGSYMGEKWEMIVTIFEEYSFIIALLLLLIMIYGSFKWYQKKIKA